MTTDELIRELRLYAEQHQDNSAFLLGLIYQSADRLESIQEENAFLKDMQRKMVDGVHDIGAMVENALKKGGQ